MSVRRSHLRCATNHNRSNQHTQPQREEQRLGDLGLQQAGGSRDRDEHQAEFAAMGQDGARAKRSLELFSEHAGQGNNKREFHHHEHKKPCQHRWPCRPNRTYMELSSDTDEERPDEQIPERPDFPFDKLASVALGDHHAGSECTERRRKTRTLRNNGREQGYGQG